MRSHLDRPHAQAANICEPAAAGRVIARRSIGALDVAQEGPRQAPGCAAGGRGATYTFRAEPPFLKQLLYVLFVGVIWQLNIRKRPRSYLVGLTDDAILLLPQPPPRDGREMITVTRADAVCVVVKRGFLGKKIEIDTPEERHLLRLYCCGRLPTRRDKGAEMTTAIETVRLAEQQIGEAGEVLARAFYDDPLFTYVLPEDEHRARVLPPFMAAGARLGHLFGEVYTGAGTVVGAAIWLPPNWGEFSENRTDAAGFPPVMEQMGEEANARFGVAMGEFGALHQRDMPVPHWYLMVLGVDPPRQGAGVGGLLIQPVLARADAGKVACYLETLKVRNVPFYRKHGFEIVVESDLPDGPHYWTMRRDPR